MNLTEFRRIITAFADEPSDVDIRLGKLVSQIRDEVIEVNIQFSGDEDQNLRVVENGQEYPARLWLMNRVARLPQLADRIISTFDQTATAIVKLPFVAPSGRMTEELTSSGDVDVPVDDVVDVLVRQASAPLPGATSVLYLTSDAGEGKTTVINRASIIQAHRFKNKETFSLIVPIPLSGRAFLTFDDAVIACLVNKLRFNYLYFDAFMELVKLGVVVPAFDGYEEMLVEGSRGEAVSALGTLVQRLDSSGTIVVAARKAFFEYLSFRTQARLLDALGDRSAAFARLAISRWNKQQFCEYGRLRCSENPESVFETVAMRLGEDHPILTRAVLVRRLFDVLEGADTHALADLLGSSPQDYFFTFVDAIVRREASEKWLARVSGEVMEPLLQQSEHHQLLAQIALEMWQSSSTSIRYDVLDVVVEIFCEGLKKTGAVTRQVKERIKQHSLLSSETARGQGIGFDHEDFQNFYLGEGLGLILSRIAIPDIRSLLSVNIVPAATVEQAVQCCIRHGADLASILCALASINQSEIGYSFCKENCGHLTIRLLECKKEDGVASVSRDMYFPSNSFGGRSIKHARFERCHFQPTILVKNSAIDVDFVDCEFERLEVDSMDSTSLCGMSFIRCHIASILTKSNEELMYDPVMIDDKLQSIGATIADGAPAVKSPGIIDDRLKLVERFLRVFLRHTHVDEDAIRVRLGKGYSSTFFDVVLPHLLSKSVLEQVPWRGQGVQMRFKLARPMSEVDAALEKAGGSFDKFLAEL